MITEQQINFLQRYVDKKYFDVDKIAVYLQLHEIVGDEIFEIATKKENMQRRIRLVERGYGYEPIKTEIFINRVPFYFYVADFDKGQHGGLDDLVYGLRGDLSERKVEQLYEVLEKMFYHHKLEIPELMGYIDQQTGVINRTDLFLQWGHYLDLCEQLNIDCKFPKSFIYSYNMVLEKSTLAPIIYEPGLVGFNENFLRNGNEIIVGGEFPCDENNNPEMRWIALWIEDAKHVTVQDVYSMGNSKLIEKTLHVGLTPSTKIYMPNIYNVDEKDDIWYPIHFGPSVMEFNKETLKIFRKNFDLTQQEVADAIGVQIRTYQKWESGATTPDGYNLIRLMNLFDISSVQEFVINESIVDNGFLKFKARFKNNSAKN